MAKILIVDDAELARQQLSEVIKAAGHEVIMAIDGADGLAKARETAGLSLIIADVNMPNIDGLTMIAQIRAIPTLKEIPTFVLTTESTPALKARGRQVGVMAWITKPINPESLVGVIKKILN